VEGGSRGGGGQEDGARRHFGRYLQRHENCKRNQFLADKGFAAPKVTKTGTTICGIIFKDGIVLGADTLGGDSPMSMSCTQLSTSMCCPKKKPVGTSETPAHIHMSLILSYSATQIIKYDRWYDIFQCPGFITNMAGDRKLASPNAGSQRRYTVVTIAAPSIFQELAGRRRVRRKQS
jgi:hypothetical protein